MAAKFRPSPLSSGPSFYWVFALILLAAVCASAQPKYANKLAPYVTSPQKVVDRMLEMAAVKPGDTVFDLGCGDGRVLVTAAQRYNARAIGIEINDRLVQRATERIASLNLQDRAKVVHGDLLEADLSGADVVVLYLMTGSNEKIRPKLEKSLKPGTRIVSYSYEVPGWKPVRVDRTDERAGHSIYLYEVPVPKK